MKNETGTLLEKASHAIHAAELLMKGGEIDFAAGRAYYAMFYTAEALLCEKGFGRFAKHKGVIAVFGENFAKTGILDSKFHRWLIDAFDKRIQGDYESLSAITSEDVASMIFQAREFLDQARRYLERPN